MASGNSALNDITVRIDYGNEPPPEFISTMRKLMEEMKTEIPGCNWNLLWEKREVTPPPASYPGDQFPAHPRGYRDSPHIPVLRAHDHCPHCLCSPCVIDLPPKFLRGSASPHPANDEKRHRLYSQFWRLLRDLGVWRDKEYLQKKEPRTTTSDDRRDIMPACCIDEVRRRYPSHHTNYRDYSSTFDAETT